LKRNLFSNESLLFYCVYRFIITQTGKKGKKRIELRLFPLNNK